MLDFCAEHNVTPEIEVIEARYVNEAYERVLASDVRYRFVIDISTCRSGRVLSAPPERCWLALPRRPRVASSRCPDASGQGPAAASLAATRAMFSGPGVVVRHVGDEVGDHVAVDRPVAISSSVRRSS